jgi:CRP-like cAMP-binding protein
MTSPAATSTEVFALNRLFQLAQLGEEDTKLLLVAAKDVRELRAREEIFGEGEPIKQAFILLEGWACRVRILRDGRRQILHFLLPGDLIGMCFQNDPTALTSVMALTDVAMCPAPQPCESESLAQLYQSSRAQEEEFLLRQITRVGRLSAQERIIDWLLEIADRLAPVGIGSTDKFPLPVTQETIADALGLTSVHVNRMLQSMWRDGLLRVRNGMVTILDRAACRQLSDYSRSASSRRITGV